jgi:hypothetical protein
VLLGIAFTGYYLPKLTMMELVGLLMKLLNVHSPASRKLKPTKARVGVRSGEADSDEPLKT